MLLKGMLKMFHCYRKSIEENKKQHEIVKLPVYQEQLFGLVTDEAHELKV